MTDCDYLAKERGSVSEASRSNFAWQSGLGRSGAQPQNTIDDPYTSCHDMYMRSHHVTLTEPVSELIESQIASGRFKDFSAAMQEAAWNYFFEKSPFEEYGVTPGQVATRYKRDVAETKRLKRAGKLKPWKA